MREYEKKATEIALAAAEAHGFIGALLGLGEIDECHREQAERIRSGIAKLLWPSPIAKGGDHVED